MTALYRLHSGSWQRGRTDKRYRLPTGTSLWRCLSKRGDFALHLLEPELWVEVSFVQRRAALARSREARVSRLIGKFDTTASERKWQVVILALLWEVPR